MTKIKICGIYRNEDCIAMNDFKPDYFGMILEFPKSHRNISFEKALEIRSLIIPSIPSVGVFVNQDIDTIKRYVSANIINVIQLHGNETEDMIKLLQKETNLPVWKAFKIRTEEDLLKALHSPADKILLDNGYGTGETFDWSKISDFSRDFILAGGITPDNVLSAIATLSPEMIDISSGVETEKKKDYNKISAVISTVRMRKET